MTILDKIGNDYYSWSDNGEKQSWDEMAARFEFDLYDHYGVVGNPKAKELFGLLHRYAGDAIGYYDKNTVEIFGQFVALLK